MARGSSATLDAQSFQLSTAQAAASGKHGSGPASSPIVVRSCHSIPAWTAVPIAEARCRSRSAAFTPLTASTTAASTYSGSRAPGLDNTSSIARLEVLPLLLRVPGPEPRLGDHV